MKKTIWLILATLFPVLLLGAGCTMANIFGTPTSTSPTTTPVAVTPTSTPIDPDLVIVEPGVVVVKTPTGTRAVATQNYMDALDIYRTSGARFQFSNCSGSPGSINFKKGVTFMIDNRDAELHIIGIGTKNYTLQGYGYAIVSVLKPGSFNITCDGGGAAHVLIMN